MKLTIGKVKGLGGKPGQRDWQVADDEQRGLRVRVGAKATPGSLAYKVYIARYSINGVKRSLPIEACAAITLDVARREVAKLMGEVAGGRDPALDRKTRRHAHRITLTLGNLIERWAAIGLKDRRATYRTDATRALKVALAKRLAGAASGFTRPDAIALVDEMVEAEKPAMARAVASYGSAAYSWAIERDLIKDNPFAKLPLPEAKQRKRTLSDEEIRAVWSATAGVGPFNAMVRMLLVTGQRLNEVARLPWAELDAGLTTWTLPAERAKNGVEHIVPLSEQARAIIAAQPRMASNDHVFAARGKGPITSFSDPKTALNRASGVEGWVLHDLRRTVATRLQKLSVKLEVTEAVLNHVGGSRAGIVGVYQRHQYADEKRAALDLWGKRLAEIIEGREPESNVTPLMRASSR
jgi:integrase